MVLGVLTAFVLASYLWPQLVKSRPHFVLAVAAVLLALIFETIAVLFASLHVLAWLFVLLSKIVEIAAFLMLLRTTSGLTFRQWFEELKTAFSNIGR